MDYMVDVNGTKVVLEDVQAETKQRVIGQYVKCRKELGMTQQQLADISGVARPNITRFESGKGNPSIDMLIRIALSMGMKIDLTMEENK